jgi:hypothetical protein
MTKSFVAIGDPVHNLLRRVTRYTPLRLCPDGAPGPRVRYEVRPHRLPEAYFSLAMLHGLGGMSLELLPMIKWRVQEEDKAGIAQRINYFDAVHLDRRCWRDLRLKPAKLGPEMLAAELLSFGTGMLRARNDDPGERIHQFLWSQNGRLESRHEVVYGRLRAMHRISLPHACQTGKESFDSTNLIYGDAFGELEQLWDRRAELDFLDRVALSLQRMSGQAEISSLHDPPLDPPRLLNLHLRRQAIWKVPPATGRALLARIERILDHVTLDCSPVTIYQGRESETRRNNVARDTDEREVDPSGYDGWLSTPLRAPGDLGY